MQNDTCYILALIKRDDGERLLLGSGYYEFTAGQKHFNPNQFANDVVELQGTDGQLLAGQVRRSTTQTFEGFIGDGTTSKQTVEQKRREFFLFFRKQHHYTVVYIMPDGTAIKRDRGYITEAPSVQELHQFQPKWRIGLAFEDVNYYSYAEDAQGNEIYSFDATLALANIADGGLIWDANGAISEAAGLENIRIDGDTVQQGTPTPSSPVAIQTVAGSQTISINGTDYPLDLGSIELCKLGTYQDYIYKDGEDWKVHKTIRKYALDGSEAWSISGIGATPFLVANLYSKIGASVESITSGSAYLSHLECKGIYGSNTNLGFSILVGSNQSNMRVRVANLPTVSDWTAWLSNTNPILYARLATSTDTTITDTTLIAQLEAVAEAMAEYGKPSAIVPTDQNLAAIITGDLTGTGGYIFAPSTGGGPIVVTVNGVDNANPVWHVYGPATNPTLTNSTTGEALTWNGTVPANQELIIDMGAQTATLEGANVFEFVSGSWVQLEPGANRVSYTAANTTKSSKIYWNEVVG